METLFEKTTAADIAELRAINDAQAAEDSVQKGAAHDYRLHARLVSILGNWQMLGGIIYEEHAGIIDALEARDRMAYPYRVSRHLEAGLSLFKQEERNT
jgi:DNA-binding FadR family transcriptional regulator